MLFFMLIRCLFWLALLGSPVVLASSPAYCERSSVPMDYVFAAGDARCDCQIVCDQSGAEYRCRFSRCVPHKRMKDARRVVGYCDQFNGMKISRRKSDD